MMATVRGCGLCLLMVGMGLAGCKGSKGAEDPNFQFDGIHWSIANMSKALKTNDPHQISMARAKVESALDGMIYIVQKTGDPASRKAQAEKVYAFWDKEIKPLTNADPVDEGKINAKLDELDGMVKALE